MIRCVSNEKSHDAVKTDLYRPTISLLFAGSRAKVQLLTDRHDHQCQLFSAQTYLSSLNPELIISTCEGRALLFPHNASNGRVNGNDDLEFFTSDSSRLPLALASQSRKLQ